MNGNLMKAILCAALMAASGTSYGAEPVTKNARSLANACKAWIAIESGAEKSSVTDDEMVESLMGSGYCVGYLNGLLAGYSAGSKGFEDTKYCLPDGVNVSQIARVLVKKMDQNPEFEHQPQLVAALGTLMGAWPCAPGQQP